MSNKIYSVALNQTVVAGGNGSTTFVLDNFNRQYYLKSITWGLLLRRVVAPPVLVPIEMNTTQEFYFTINTIAGAKIAQSFFNFFPAPPAMNIEGDGTELRFHYPGQYKFETLVIFNTINCLFWYINQEAVDSFLYRLSVIMEVEEVVTRYAK